VEWNTLTDQSVLGLYTRDQLKEMGVTLVDPTQIARDDGNGKLMLNGVQVGTVTYARARWTSAGRHDQDPQAGLFVQPGQRRRLQWRGGPVPPQL
jgi:hypothetical protein